MHPGLLGGLIGAVIGLSGGILGTYFSIKNAKGPKTKAFMIKVSIAMWLGAAFFIVLLFLVPLKRQWILWFAYTIVLPVTIVRINQTYMKLHQEENT